MSVCTARVREYYAAEREKPPGAGWQRFIEQRTLGVSIPRPGLDPVEDPPHSRTRTWPFSTRVSMRSSGRGGGPSSTCPLTSKTPP